MELFNGSGQDEKARERACKRVSVSRRMIEKLEASPGIEPGCKDLQSSA